MGPARLATGKGEPAELDLDLHPPARQQGDDGWCYPAPSAQVWVSPSRHGGMHQKKHTEVLLLKQTGAAGTLSSFSDSVGVVLQESISFCPSARGKVGTFTQFS